jgi:hypothetical protein
VWKKRKGVLDLQHVGSVHDERELVVLTGVARRMIAGRQGELDLGLDHKAGL